MRLDFESAVEKRKSSREKKSAYSYVNSRHGKPGYFSDWTVECTSKHDKFNLGRVIDEKVGAFLTCAKFVDPGIKDRWAAKNLLDTLVSGKKTTSDSPDVIRGVEGDIEGEAKKWLDKVRPKIDSIPPCRGGVYYSTPLTVVTKRKAVEIQKDMQREETLSVNEEKDAYDEIRDKWMKIQRMRV